MEEGKDVYTSGFGRCNDSLPWEKIDERTKKLGNGPYSVYVTIRNKEDLIKEMDWEYLFLVEQDIPCRRKKTGTLGEAQRLAESWWKEMKGF